MLSLDQARQVVFEQFPNSKIEKAIDHENLYIFVVENPSDELEGSWDGFYSVDRETGDLEDFPLLTHKDSDAIFDKLEAA